MACPHDKLSDSLNPVDWLSLAIWLSPLGVGLIWGAL